MLNTYFQERDAKRKRRRWTHFREPTVSCHGRVSQGWWLFPSKRNVFLTMHKCDLHSKRLWLPRRGLIEIVDRGKKQLGVLRAESLELSTSILRMVRDYGARWKDLVHWKKKRRRRRGRKRKRDNDRKWYVRFVFIQREFLVHVFPNDLSFAVEFSLTENTNFFVFRNTGNLTSTIFSIFIVVFRRRGLIERGEKEERIVTE